MAPPLPPLDEAGIRNRHRRAALKGIPFWKRADRNEAAKRAAASAQEEIVSTLTAQQMQRQELQAELDARWKQLLGNDPDVVLATLTEAFEDNEAHAAAVSVEQAEAHIAVFVPGPEIVPERMPSTTAAGNLSLKKTTSRELAGVYTTAVCGHVLATVRESFAVAPGLASVRIAAVRLSSPDVYGQKHLECLLAATFQKGKIEGVDWAHAQSPDIFDQCASHVNVNMTGRVKHLDPINLQDEPELADLVAAIDIEDAWTPPCAETVGPCPVSSSLGGSFH